MRTCFVLKISHESIRPEFIEGIRRWVLNQVESRLRNNGGIMEIKIIDWNWYRLNSFVWTGWFFWFFNTGIVIRSEVPGRQANGLFQPVELAMFNSEKLLLEPKKQVGLLPRFEDPLASVGLKEGSCNNWEIKIPDEFKDLFLSHTHFLQSYEEYKREKADLHRFRIPTITDIPEEIENNFLDFRFSVILE